MSRSSTSTSNRHILARVCTRAGFFLAPLVLFAGFFEMIFWRARECWSTRRVIEALETDPQTLYGPRYFASNMEEIKRERLQSGRMQVVALGSSRVTQFRAPMFAPMEHEFLNAGLMATNTPELLSMIGFFTENKFSLPRVLIVGIDPWWIKKRPAPEIANRWKDRSERIASTTAASAHVDAIRRFCSNFRVPWPVLWRSAAMKDSLYGYNAIGLGALSGNGYLADGSVLQSDYILDYIKTGRYVDREVPPVIERIRRRTHQFGATTGVDWTEVDRIIKALSALKSRGVEVYAFLPPFSIEADQELQKTSGLDTWYAEYREKVPLRLNAAGIVCVDLRSPATYGLADDYMIDGFHPGDVLMTYILEELVRRAAPHSVLSSVKVEQLRQLREGPGVIPISLHPPPGLRPSVLPAARATVPASAR